MFGAAIEAINGKPEKRLAPTKPTTAVEYFAKLTAREAEVRQPTKKRNQRIAEGHQRWFERELTRPGAHVSGAAPEEVEAALAAETRKEEAAVHQFFAEADVQIAADYARRAASIIKQSEALVAELREFHAFEQGYRDFARSCGTWRAKPQSVEAIAHELNEWAAQIRRRLEPEPVRVMRVRPETNPVVVAD